MLGSGVIAAFDDGLAAADIDYDFVAKMDVDLEFPPRYLEWLRAANHVRRAGAFDGDR